MFYVGSRDESIRSHKGSQVGDAAFSKLHCTLDTLPYLDGMARETIKVTNAFLQNPAKWLQSILSYQIRCEY